MLTVAGGAIVAVLVAGVGVAAWQWQIAETARTATRSALDRVTREQTETRKAFDRVTEEEKAKAAALAAMDEALDNRLAAMRRMTVALGVGRIAGLQVGESLHDGQLHKVLREPEEVARIREVLTLWEEVAAARGDSPRARLLRAEGACRVGCLRVELGEDLAAQRALRTALAGYEKLNVDHPGNPDYKAELATAHWWLCATLDSTGRSTAAEVEYRAALRTWKALTAEHPAIPEYRSRAARSHWTLSKLVVASCAAHS